METAILRFAMRGGRRTQSNSTEQSEVQWGNKQHEVTAEFLSTHKNFKMIGFKQIGSDASTIFGGTMAICGRRLLDQATDAESPIQIIVVCSGVLPLLGGESTAGLPHSGYLLTNQFLTATTFVAAGNRIIHTRGQLTIPKAFWYSSLAHSETSFSNVVVSDACWRLPQEDASSHPISLGLNPFLPAR